jgi:hypothetical protein
MADLPFFSGKDAKMRLFMGNSEVNLNAKTWSAKPNVTKWNEGVNGEDADRLGSILNFWEFDFEGFQRDVSAFNAFLADVGLSQLQVAPQNINIGIVIKMYDGTKAAYQALECTRDDFEMNQGGRTDRVMLKGGFRSRYFKQLQAP